MQKYRRKRKKNKGGRRYQGFLSFAYSRFPFCQWCGGPLFLENDLIRRHRSKTASTDHIIPKSKGGTDDWSNLLISCKECNEDRGNGIAGSIWCGPNNWSQVREKEIRKKKKKDNRNDV